MDQDTHTCPGCGAHTPEPSTCPYCGWTSERETQLNSAENRAQTASPSTEATRDGSDESAASVPAHLSDLLNQNDDPEPLLEQVPEELRGVLAARLRAASPSSDTGFSEKAARALREEGYVVTEDARGARFAAAPGKVPELSSSDVVKLAADQEGGVQQQAKLPICGECQAASPIDATQCQWCGQPFAAE